MRALGRIHWHTVLVALILVAGPAGAAGNLTVVDDITHVRNGAVPREGREVWDCEELWRIGGEDDEDLLLGLVSDIGADEEGRVYVLDAQLCCVHVFNRDGRQLRTLFREGDGPGEVRGPRDLVVLPEGVGLAQEYPGKVVIVDRQGDPVPSLVLGADRPGEAPRSSLTAVGCGGGNIVVSGALFTAGAQPGTQDRTYFLSSYARNGAEDHRYLDCKGVYNYNDFTFSEREHIPAFWWGYTVGNDGRLYAVPERNEYRIHIYSPHGTLERVIERDTELHARTDAIRGRFRRLLESATAGMPIEVKFQVEPFDPPISFYHRALHVADDGCLWVTTSEGLQAQPDGIMLTYDVFDPVGHFIKQASVACDGDGYDDCLFFVGGDRAVLVKGYIDALAAQFGSGSVAAADGEEPTVPEVICYQLRPRES